MDEKFEKSDVDLLISSIRRGIPLNEGIRTEFANTTRALLKKSDTFTNTANFLARQCAKKMSEFDSNLDEQWIEDISEEIQWWWAWTLGLIENGKIEKWKHFSTDPFPFEQYISEFDENGHYRVLNIGSGPRSNMGEKSRLKNLNILNMDPLASAYNAIMGILNAPSTGKIEFGAVEILSKLSVGTFDFIAAKNCLDHAYDVPKGLGELVDALNPRGIIALEHYQNEAEAQHYLGLHKWNIEIKDDRIHVWNKTVSCLFDHEKYGFELHHSTEDSIKGSGAPHPKTFIKLIRR